MGEGQSILSRPNSHVSPSSDDQQEIPVKDIASLSRVDEGKIDEWVEDNLSRPLRCPLCPIGSIKRLARSRLREHLRQRHVKHGVKTDGLVILPCNLPCKAPTSDPRLHYHCTCGAKVTRRTNMVLHLKRNHGVQRQKANAKESHPICHNKEKDICQEKEKDTCQDKEKDTCQEKEKDKESERQKGGEPDGEENTPVDILPTETVIDNDPWGIEHHGGYHEEVTVDLGERETLDSIEPGTPENIKKRTRKDRKKDRSPKKRKHSNAAPETSPKILEPNQTLCSYCEKVMSIRSLRRHIRRVHKVGQSRPVLPDYTQVSPRAGFYTANGGYFPLHVRCKKSTGEDDEDLGCQLMDTSTVLSIESKGWGPATLQGIYELRENQVCCDVSVVVQDGSVLMAHGVVLAAGSSFFKDIVHNRMNGNSVTVECNFSRQTMESIIDFLYHGKVSLKVEDLKDITKAAEAFGIQALVDFCQAFKNQGQELNIQNTGSRWNANEFVFCPESTPGR